MPDIPSWVAALIGALAAALVTWGALREKIHTASEAVKDIPTLKAHQTRCDEMIAQMRDQFQDEVSRIRFHADETHRLLMKTALDVAMLKGKDES